MVRASHSSPSFAVVIPAHNATRTLARCLRAVRPQLDEGDELVVVDDGSTDRTSEAAEREGATVLRLRAQGGAGAARNAGVAVTTAPWMLFIDADVYLPSNLLARLRGLVSALEDQDAVVAVYEARPMHRNPASLFLHLGQAFRMHSLAPGPGTVLGTSCAAVRRRAFEAVGGFPTEEEFAGSEDRSFGEKLGHGRVLLRSDIQVAHDRPIRLAGLLRMNARRAFSEARWRARDGKLGILLKDDRQSYLGARFVLQILSAPLVCAAPLAPIAALPYAVTNAPLWRFAARNAGASALPGVIAVGWLSSMVVLAAGGAGALVGRFAPPPRRR